MTLDTQALVIALFDTPEAYIAALLAAGLDPKHELAEAATVD
jgi:hypothetical protein